MEQYYIDAGTTRTKILKIENNKKEYSIIPSLELRKTDIVAKNATGHSIVKTESYENEVVALARGAKKYLDEDYVVLDVGSRDIKWVKFKNKKFKDMDWNTACASATGATVEMLLKFYNVDIKNLKFTKEKYSITCGIFGLEKIMDDVSKGLEAEVAISKFIHGLAFRAFNFTKNPEKLCLSGGFCENPCFIESLKQYCEVLPLGSFVLVDGLLKD